MFRELTADPQGISAATRTTLHEMGRVLSEPARIVPMKTIREKGK
jgi:hypothetical protein